MDEIKKCFPDINSINSINSMNGYESPVTLFEGPWHQIAEKISKDTDSFIFDSITSLGISIDKEELIKAIQYDRDQYSKGYKNGYDAGYKAAMEGVQSLADFMSNVRRDCGLHE